MDFVAAFEARVETCPDALAVRCEDVALSYGELNRRVNRVSHGLLARGVRPEIVVGLIGERDVDFLVMLLAVLKAGGVYLPLDPRHPKLRHQRVLQESGAAIVLASHACLE